MRNLFNRQFDMLVRVLAFAKKYADVFSETSLARKLFGIIEATLPELRKSAGLQDAGFALNRGGATSRGQARAVLFDCMDAISLAARSMGRENPEIAAKFTMPYSLGDRDVVGRACGFVQNAEAMKDDFLAYELEPDFIEQLKAAIKRFEDSIATHAEAKATQANATASVEDTIETAMDAVCQLDGIIPNKFRKSYPVLREWESARRVAQARASKPVSNGPPQPEPGPEPAPATAPAPTQA